MASVEGSSSGAAAIQYDYGTSDDKSSDSNNKALRFNGDLSSTACSLFPVQSSFAPIPTL